MTTEKASFVYSIYIQTNVEKLWDALFNPEMTKLYWWRHRNVSDWKIDTGWEHQDYDQPEIVDIVGKVLEKQENRRLVISWADAAEKNNEAQYSKVTFEIKKHTDSSQLILTHENLEPGSTMFNGIVNGWPVVLSSLKTLMETGKALEGTTKR